MALNNVRSADVARVFSPPGTLTEDAPGILKAIALAAACALLVAGAARSAEAPYAADIDLFRARFDALAEQVPHVQIFGGELAPWTQGYVLLGYALMYESTRDFVRLAEANPNMAEGGVRLMMVDLFYGGALPVAPAASLQPEGGDGEIWLDCFYVVPVE